MRRSLFALTAALFVAQAPQALAAPDAKLDIGGAPAFTIEGPAKSGLNPSTELGDAVCEATPFTTCHQVLLKATTAGTVTLATEMSASTDIDTALFSSNEAGERGAIIADGTGSAGATETVAGPVAAGEYVLFVAAYYAAANSGFTTKGTFEPDAVGPEPSAVAPTGANQAPTTAIAAPGRSARAKSLKSFKGTAGDKDGKVARVEIGLIKRSGKGCTELRSKGRFAKVAKCEPKTFLKAKGTNRWSFKLAKPLAKGTYVLYVRAVDDKGLVQSGFGSGSKRSFRVR